MNQIELKSLAKINLGLDVLGRRENGYHDVRMVMQSIYLHDEVKLTKKEEPGIELTTNLRFLPTGDTNIAYKAAQLLIDEFDIKEGVKIVLNKHIPVAAGLAGGSSNAAAAGTVAQIPKNVFGSGRTLAVHMYNLSSEGLYMDQAYATAVILLVLVVLINTLSGVIARRLASAE